jgi:hypothetical protein
MQGLEAARLDVCAALLAGSVEPLVEAPQSLVERGYLGPRGIVDRLQGFIVLHLHGSIAPIPDQRVIAALEVAANQGVALLEIVTSAGQSPPDLTEILELS